MRRIVLLALGLLVAAGLAVVTSGTAQASPGERWCGPGVAKPCIVSFTYNGASLDAAASMDLTVSHQSDAGYGHIFNFSVQPDGSAPIPATLDPSDTINLVVDTGGYHPDYIVGFEHQTDVDVWHAASGDWMLRVSGSPVKVGSGCDSDAAWPWPCPVVSDDDSVYFEGDVSAYDAGVNQDFVGFYAGTNVTYNGIFSETDSTGHQFLEMEAVAPHEFTDHSVVVGSVHFRVPYVMLQDDFGIPDPSTMTAGSMTGTVNGSSATFDIAQDPDGGGVYVDVSGFTFTHRTIKVRAGLITPTRPTITSAHRSTTSRGVVKHTLSTPRGAKVTGYVARCVAGRRVATGTGSHTSRGVVVTGLHAGRAYSCTVRAKSRVGMSRASVAAMLPRH